MVYVGAGFVNRFHAFPTSCSSPCSPLWTAFTESNAVTAPAIAGGTVYLVEFNGALQAFPTECSTPCMPIWTMRGFSPYSSPAVANGVVYVGGADSKLYALDALTGAILFSGPTGGSSYPLSPAIADGVVYVTVSFFSPGTLVAFTLPQ
jgi:outer membrane protein assembly factor BamB